MHKHTPRNKPQKKTIAATTKTVTPLVDEDGVEDEESMEGEAMGALEGPDSLSATGLW